MCCFWLGKHSRRHFPLVLITCRHQESRCRTAAERPRNGKISAICSLCSYMWSCCTCDFTYVFQKMIRRQRVTISVVTNPGPLGPCYILQTWKKIEVTHSWLLPFIFLFQFLKVAVSQQDDFMCRTSWKGPSVSGIVTIFSGAWIDSLSVDTLNSHNKSIFLNRLFCRHTVRNLQRPFFNCNDSK